MSRQLKFRAWVKSDKRMITDKQDFIPLIVTNKGVMKLQPQFEASYYEILPNEWFELMQFTGLKDKNGVDIYEGDIVEYEDFSGGLYLFKEQPKAIGIIKIDNLLTGIYLKGMGTFKGSKVEIIGNIYEHAELIKEREQNE